MHAPILRMITQTMHKISQADLDFNLNLAGWAGGFQKNDTRKIRKHIEWMKKKSPKYEKKSKRSRKQARWNRPTSQQGKERKQ